MKYILFILFFFFGLCSLKSQHKNHATFQIYFDENNTLDKLVDLGVAIDHGFHKEGLYYISEFTYDDIEKIINSGFQVNDIDFNTTTLKNFGNNCEGINPVNIPNMFELGSMGGFFTFTELVENLDEMHNFYPNLITNKIPIGTSVEGHSIYSVIISDNPGINENEPAVLYTALHHAREPMSATQLIFFMHYILENYNSNDLIKYLLDNTELHFIVCVNPDGYLYNESIEPNGGGMWRKNRKDNGNGSFGIDLNRNYGFTWGYDDFGSSSDSYSDTYRGVQEFSEPETEAITDYCILNQFKIVLNYHSYGNLLIYPWGYEENIYTLDSGLYVNHSRFLVQENSFIYGTGNQTVGYVVNGCSDDWMYGDVNLKPKAFSFTPEVGGVVHGFWPDSNDIIPLCFTTVNQNIKTGILSGKYAEIKDITETYFTSNIAYFKYSAKSLGLDSLASFEISINPITSNIQNVGNLNSYLHSDIVTGLMDSISLEISPLVSFGEEIVFIVNNYNGIYTFSDTITKIFGTPLVLYSNSGEQIGFEPSSWAITDEFAYSENYSFTDSPYSNYLPDDVNVVGLAGSFDLSSSISAELNFKARWQIEPRFDAAQIIASIDNGISWEALCGQYTKKGSWFQDYGYPVYEGFQNNWVSEKIDLTPYCGESNLLLSFSMMSDEATEMDGFYIDDICLLIIDTLSANILDNSFAKTFIYPNPVKNIFSFINMPLGSELFTYTIYNTMGNTVKSGMMDNHKNNIVPIPLLNSGMYILQIENSIYSKQFKLIKVKN